MHLWDESSFFFCISLISYSANNLWELIFYYRSNFLMYSIATYFIDGLENLQLSAYGLFYM